MFKAVLQRTPLYTRNDGYVFLLTQDVYKKKNKK